MNIVVAIDGPVAAGKSTVAKLVAEKLNYRYVDTGAMYRCVALLAWRNNFEGTNEDEIRPLLENIDIVLGKDRKVFLNGEDVTMTIRIPEISRLVSIISVHKSVRDFLIAKQRKLGQEKGVVMEGRDIGSFVMPGAELKIFQIATVESRAQRRFLELQEKGIPCHYDKLINDIIERDLRDSTREHSPLKRAEDSIVLDTSNITAEEAADIIVEYAKKVTT